MLQADEWLVAVERFGTGLASCARSQGQGKRRASNSKRKTHFSQVGSLRHLAASGTLEGEGCQLGNC